MLIVHDHVKNNTFNRFTLNKFNFGKVEDPNYRHYQPRVEKEELYCVNGKDVVQSLQSREHANLHVKQGVNGRNFVNSRNVRPF